MQKIKFLSDMRARIQTIPTCGGGGGGSNCFSREVRTSFSSKKQMATYDFHGEVRTPCPLCLRPYQSFKQFEFTFYLFIICLAWSIHKTSARPDDQKTVWTMFFFNQQPILQFTEWIQWFYYRGEEGGPTSSRGWGCPKKHI